MQKLFGQGHVDTHRYPASTYGIEQWWQSTKHSQQSEHQKMLFVGCHQLNNVKNIKAGQNFMQLNSRATVMWNS